jgi:hypothetical protein
VRVAAPKVLGFLIRSTPIDLSRVETFPGAACSTRFVVIHAPRDKSRGFLGYDPKRLARRSLPSLDEGAKSGSSPGPGHADSVRVHQGARKACRAVGLAKVGKRRASRTRA